MADSKFNAIVILDAVPDGEYNTARRLKEELLDICYFEPGLNVRYIRLNTIDDLKNGLSSILFEIKCNKLKPWLHLDGHGINDESGFVFANGSQCNWSQLKECITPLNVELGLNLILILSTCYGGSFTRCIETTDRAPVLGLIGPTSKVSISEVEKVFPTFYRTFFETLSLTEALKSLDQYAQAPNIYYRISAEQFFYDVWSNYKLNYCTEEAIEYRAKKLFKRAQNDNISHATSIDQIKRKFREKEPIDFNIFRDTYFMYDLYEENKENFQVTYEKAESFVSNNTCL